MSRRSLVKIPLGTAAACFCALLLGCTSKPVKAAEKPAAPVVAPVPPPEKLPRVMLGIDVLEADGFKAIAGKKIGLLTHPAGVNRRGESTIHVLRRAPQSRLVTLFASEHGLWGLEKASVNIADTTDPRTGLRVLSLHGKLKKPSPAMLKGLDALVIDLQDNGSRSYTFTSAMLCALAGCFEAGVEVIVLDRPNPLGGLKVDGPPLDADLKSYVGAFRVPYVHGLTIGELARMAKDSAMPMFIPDLINVPDKVRAKGKLTVIPMRGWTRGMRWPETGLTWVPTSPMMPTYEATVGYAMVGLGTQNTAWTSGIGKEFPFRGISYPRKTPDEIIAALDAYKIPGIRLVKQQGLAADGKLRPGVYVQVTDWEAWRPTELAFYMQKQAVLWSQLNPFAVLTTTEQRTFKIHVGSNAWYAAISREGGKVNVPSFIQNWTERAKIYQEQSRKYWLYP